MVSNELIKNLQIAKQFNILNIEDYAYMTSHIVIYLNSGSYLIFSLIIDDIDLVNFSKKLNRIIKLNNLKNG